MKSFWWVAVAWTAMAGLAEVLAAERDVVRTFPVALGCTLKVDTFAGALVIDESESMEVRVTLEIQAEADTEAEAERLCSAVQMDLFSQDNTVSVVLRNRRDSGIRFVLDERDRVNVSIRVTVPRQCHLDLRARSGSMMIGNLAGSMRARLEQGTVTFRRIDGTIDANIGEGDIIISRCSGAVSAHVRRGSIRVGTIGGPLKLKTSSGDIEVLTAKAGVTASAAVGDVTVGFAANVAGNSRLDAAAGNIHARIDPAAKFKVDASALWGRVRCHIPLTVVDGGDGKRKIVGALNGGGPVLKLRSSGGHVTIEPAEMPFE